MIFAIALLFNVVSGSILFWGPKPMHIPALIEFTNQDLKTLAKELDDSQIITFVTKNSNAAHNLNKFLQNSHMAYVLNTKLNYGNAKELNGDEAIDFHIMQDTLKNQSNANNNKIIALIMEDTKRLKRKANNSTTGTENTETPYIEPITEPVLYSAVSPSNNHIESMIYSSKPLFLKTKVSYIVLGEATINTMDIRDSYTRLIAKIRTENGKVSLKFKFNWLSGYWFMNSIEVEIFDVQTRQYNLTLSKDLSAPRWFSYHCGGEAIFTDIEKDVELYLYDVQAQPDVRNHRFSDAYNCVPFSTAPILSGLFVSSILVIGLAFGLSALGSIKTMDKFDNHKTKQLCITIWE